MQVDMLWKHRCTVVSFEPYADCGGFNVGGSAMTANRHAIVFGGSGFIGCHFLKRVAEMRRYDRIYSVDIAPPRFSINDIRYVNFDIRNRFRLLSVVMVHSTYSTLPPSTRHLVMKTGNIIGPTFMARQTSAGSQATWAPTMYFLPAP